MGFFQTDYAYLLGKGLMDREKLLLKYKDELDEKFKFFSPTSILKDDYLNLLAKVKLEGFRVYRSEQGKHKLVDTGYSEALDFLDSLFSKRKGY